MPCTQPDGNCQLPDQGGHGDLGIIGATSDLTVGFHVIEGFRNDTGGFLTITEVCWWGFYLDFDLGEDCDLKVPSDDFTITLYLNTPGCPNGEPNLAQSQVHAIGNTALKAATGNLVGGQNEYEYSAQGLSIGPLADGTCYWLGIQNNTPGTVGPNCVWLWSTADGNGNSYQDGAPDPINDFDLAVCVNATIGDQSFCSLVPDAACDMGSTNNCWEAGDGVQIGCDDPCCCTLTCQALAFCCFAPWDETCAAVALDIGCTELPPLPLCCADPCEEPGKPVENCQVYTALNAFNSTGDPGAGADLFHAADDFQVAVDGVITSLCFQGAYGTAAVTDSFIVTIYDDNDGLPGNVIGTASESGGTLAIDARMDTNLEIIAGVPVYQYTTTINPGIAVVADTCYWIEIINNIGDVPETWFWEWAEIGPTPFDPTAAPRQGNGRALVDGVGDGVEEPDGYDFFGDTVTSNDFAFCINLPLATDICGFGDMGTDTGPHDFVLFNGADSHLGWSSGDLDAGPGVDDQRRTVQAFTLPAIPVGAGLAWGIEHLLLEGFDPGNINEFINFEIFTRTALDVAPTSADTVALFEEIEFGGGFDGDTEEFGIIIQDFFLDPGDYWLTFWASNSSGGTTPANIAWFTGAPDGIKVVCTANMPPPAAGYEGCIPNDPGPNGDPDGSPAMLRARLYPVPGFGAYTLDPTVLDISPASSNPDLTGSYLYSAAFRLRMRTGVPPVLCPWDCEPEPDGEVGINDFLAVLAQWTTVGSSCDFAGDPDGVGINAFLAILANWGVCP